MRESVTTIYSMFVYKNYVLVHSSCNNIDVYCGKDKVRLDIYAHKMNCMLSIKKPPTAKSKGDLIIIGCNDRAIFLFRDDQLKLSS